ncbi:hypothetical protein FUU19_16605 [Serratia sp. Lou2A]|jgi:hypothetical protein|uniref:Uncharacterized protein n=2 Tax=Serratia TaxID=613 RepID=A0AA46K2N7_SERMA|nr:MULTISPECIES: hypothetical protein [Serratia]MBL5822037.1 hypothetical protein [Serratia marcescens]MCC7585116.1 hypothetical protein [Serratia sp. Lou2A]MCC7660818.1 hypothetical protein [Serratia sp. Pon4B]TQI83476.1 hypothetical protein FHU12_0957 [Serratia marcescens]BEM33929.1 hypothetical protein SME06J_26210 [Serratia marcescens]
MTYNQKAWLGVLLLCTLFWVAVIGGACSLYNRADRLNTHTQESEFAARHSLAPCSQQGAQASTAPRNG